LAKKPTRVASRTVLLSEIKRIAKQFPDAEITRDFFRANSKYERAIYTYWPSFPAFAMAAGVKVVTPPTPSAPATPDIPMSPEQKVELEKDKMKAKKDDLASKVKVLTEQNLRLEGELLDVFSIRDHTPQVTIIVPKVSSGTSESVAVFVASDWHVEENVEPGTVGFRNEFNLEIADIRIQNFFKGSFRLFDILSRDTTIKTIILALLGDFITNTLHEDLQESNNLMPADAIYFAENKIVSGIYFLLEHCPKDVTFLIVCHSGNHGRMTKKQRGTTEAGNSLEHYMYYHLRDFFKGEERIKFQIAEGYHSLVRLFDNKYTIRFHHGHSIKYGGGVGGITIPVLKAIDKWNTGDKDVNLDVFGHFHQFIDYGNFVANGSLIGQNDFAVRIKAAFEKPQQAFFLVNKKWNSKTMVTPVFLD
jgi:hypothetical protein